MTLLLRKIFNIREGEGLRALLMFAYIFFIIASLLIVKPVRNSLFLTAFGPAQLPYAFILVAIFAALVATVYAGFAAEIPLNTLIYTTLLVCMACLFIFWLLLEMQFQAGWFIYAIYIWAAIFGVVTTSQFWLLANYTFNAREAKRLFGFIGAGAICGGIFGGYLTTYMAPIIGTTNLLLLCIVALAFCIGITALVWRQGAGISYQDRLSQLKRQKFANSQVQARPLRLIMESQHLKFTAGLVGVSVIVANLVDYQFNAIASDVIQDRDELTAFFGFWLSNLSIASLFIQLFVTGRVLQTFGVGASLFFLPAGILAGALTILFYPTLWAAVLIRVCDGAFKQSINKAGLELLILPIPKAIKDQAKAFVDVFVDSFATGVGGLLLVLATGVIGLSTGQISLVIITLIGLWIAMILRIRAEYIHSFRLAIEKRTIEVDEPDINLKDATVFENIVRILQSTNDRQILYVLELLQDIQHDPLIPQLENLLSSPSPEIRVRCLRMLRKYKNVDVSSRAREMVEYADRSIRIEALSYLCERTPNSLRTLRHYLSHDDHHVRAAALICAAREARDNPAFRRQIDLKHFFDEIWRTLRQCEGSAERVYLKVAAAEAIGDAGDPRLFPYLHILLNDPSIDVLRAAIKSTGKTHSGEFVPILIQHLQTKFVRREARQALAAYGEAIVETLEAHLLDPRENHAIRVALPRVLAMIKSQKSVNALVRNLNENDLFLRTEIIKALNKLKMQMPMLKYDPERVEKRILDEAQEHLKLILFLAAQNGRQANKSAGEKAEGPHELIRRARRLLLRALDERLEANLERIFRLLGLKYAPEDMLNAYKGIVSRKSDLRANAIEFLDNVLDANLKKLIIPLVESSSPFSLIRRFNLPPRQEIRSDADCLEDLLEGNDNWLRVCALYFIAVQQHTPCLEKIGKFLNESDPLVRETARLALKEIEQANESAEGK